jgi:hypothetical protein
MSEVADILAELSSRGVAVRVDGEVLRLRPKAALDDDLQARVKDHKREIIHVLTKSKPADGESWPPESIDAERRFGQPHARLFPFLGRKVRTPSGPGTLIQIFADRATVILDSELQKCAVFRPERIEPVRWELD